MGTLKTNESNNNALKQWVITINILEWQKSKILKMPNAEKDVA